MVSIKIDNTSWIKRSYRFTLKKMESEGSNDVSPTSVDSKRLGKRMINRSYGGIIRYKSSDREEYLLVKQRYMSVWSFPKGHGHELEPQIDTAKREIYEETGLQLVDEPIGKRRYKRGIYFVFDLKEKPEKMMIPDAREIEEVKWVTVEEMKELKNNSGIKLFMEKKDSKKLFSTQ